MVHIKNAMILKDYLQCDFISHAEHIPSVIDKTYDAIICVYASPYMKYNAYLEILDRNPDAKIFWMMNDHDVEDNILLRKWTVKYSKQYDMICNNPRSGYRDWILKKKVNEKTLNDWINNWYTVNLNTLVFDENKYLETKDNQLKDEILYYGTFRKNRIKDMKDYNNVSYRLSSNRRNHLKYQSAGITAKFIEKLVWDGSKCDLFEPVGLRLKDFMLSIYFEDEHTHENYAFMANRFYECLMHNTLMVYDYRCQRTIDLSGYNIHPRQIVKNGDELLELYSELKSDKGLYLKLMQVQQSNVELVLKEKEEVLKTIKNSLN
jgi:hypothetical protein